MNKIYKLSDDEFIGLIKDSLNISEVLFKLGYSIEGNSWGFSQVKKRMSDLNLSGYDFKGKSVLSNIKKEFNYNELFSEHSKHSRSVLRRYIIKNDILPYKCALCGIVKWNGKTLSLELDHINGISNDNRLENLRFLCPNCHSQTTTYGAKNNRRLESKFEISEELEDLICKEYIQLGSIKKVAKKYGLHIKAINQVLKKNSLKKPNQVYVIMYKNNVEINRFGSIRECCNYIIDNSIYNVKSYSSCKRLLRENNGIEYNGFIFKRLDV